MILTAGCDAHRQVHLARVVETGELVALKGIHVRSSGQGLPDNVIREIMCLRSVEDPHVVRLRDVFPKVWGLNASNQQHHSSHKAHKIGGFHSRGIFSVCTQREVGIRLQTVQ